MSLSDRLLTVWLPFLSEEDLALDEIRQRLFVAVGAFFAAPGLLFLSYREAVDQQWLMCALTAIGCLTLIVGYFLSRGSSYNPWIPRTIFAYMLGVILLQIIQDRGQFTLYYPLITPIISVFLFGRREGVGWSLVVFALILPLVLFPLEFGVASLEGAWTDFVGTYIIIASFSAGYETLREQASKSFQDQKEELVFERDRVLEVKEKLRERELRFKAFANLNSNWLLEFDPEFVVEYASPEIEIRVPDAVGRSVEDMLAILGADRKLLNRVRAGDEVNSEMIVVPTPTGRLAYYLVSAKPEYDEDGNLLGYIAGGKDITETEEKERELKIKEQALMHTQKLEALGQLTSGVTHDFNNLLTVISGNLELLEEAAISGGEQESLRAGLRAVDRAAELTGQLLSFSRKQNLEPVTVEVASLFTTMTDMLKRTLGDAIEVNQEIEKDLWSCLADSGQLESAMLNLAINARDAMSGEGTLHFRAKNFKYDGEGQLSLHPGEYVAIAVEDTGLGIDPSHLERIIEPFFTTKPMGEGTGLGLSMIYGFVTQSGGALGIESALGEGATFTMYLPRAMVQIDDRDESNRKDLGPALSIVVVEDDAGVRRIIERILRRVDHSVEMFESAEEALASIGADSPDLVISDIMLGSGMSGLSFAKEVKCRYPEKRLFLMSGNPESQMTGEEFETYPLLKKPFSSEELHNKIRSVTETP